MDRVTVIKKSCSVFLCGLLSLIPIIGLVPSIYSLISIRQIRIGFNESWNPASGYLRAGAIMARLGFFCSAILVLILVAAWFLA
jgi:hypothetical protein